MRAAAAAVQQIRAGPRQRGVSQRPATDDDLVRRLRTGIDAGRMPAPDLADVQRRADRRARRRTVRTAAVAGASALALVGVLAVAVPAIDGVRDATVADRAARTGGGDDRAGGVDDARLTGFTDPRRWATLPPLRTIGPPPPVWLSTEEDLEVAFPGTRSWEGQSIGGTGTDWLRSWCTSGLVVEGYVSGRPGGDPAGYPADESASAWQGRAAVLGRPRVDVDVLRWRSPDPADAWGTEIDRDASRCPGAVALDPAGLPGERATLTAVRNGGSWRVQALTVGGPTAVRVQATIRADDAGAAGEQAVALARRVVANVVRADDVEQGRPDPGPLP